MLPGARYSNFFTIHKRLIKFFLEYFLLNMARKSKKQKQNPFNKTVILLSIIFLCALGVLFYFIVPLKDRLYYGTVFFNYLKYLLPYVKGRGYYVITGIIASLFYLMLITPNFLFLAKKIFGRDYRPAKSDMVMAVIYFLSCVLSFTLIIFSLSGVYNNFIKFEHRSYIFIDILYFITSCITGNNNDIIPMTASAKLCLILINLLIYVHMTFTGIIIFKIIDKRE